MKQVAGGFSSCTVLGTVLIREPSGRHSAKITRMLEAYLKQQQASPNKDTSLKAEIRVLVGYIMKLQLMVRRCVLLAQRQRELN